MKNFCGLILASLSLLLFSSFTGAADFDYALWRRLISSPDYGFAAGGRTNYFITMDMSTPGFEEAAVSAYNWSDKQGALSVGIAARAYSAGSYGGTWGIAAEAINAPLSVGTALLGGEFLVGSRGPWNDSSKWGVNIIFMNRATTELEVGKGGNRFNNNSAAIQIDAQRRSSAGEYSGWQSGIKFSNHALDRSLDKQYAAVIDISEIVLEDRFYFLVWMCGDSKCGLEMDDISIKIWKNIDTVPVLVRRI